jgi:hypothetical protein
MRLDRMLVYHQKRRMNQQKMDTLYNAPANIFPLRYGNYYESLSPLESTLA